MESIISSGRHRQSGQCHLRYKEDHILTYDTDTDESADLPLPFNSGDLDPPF